VQATPITVHGRARDLAQWAAAILFLLVLAALLSRQPALTGAVLLVLGTFVIGLLAPLEWVFPLLGFLVVFDSVFSLGTEINSSAVVLIGISISNPLLVGVASRLLVEAGLRKRALSRPGIWVAGAVIGTALVSSWLSPDKLTRATITIVGAGVLVLVLTSYWSKEYARRLFLGLAVGTACVAATALITLFRAERGLSTVGKVYRVIGSNRIQLPRVTGIYQDPNALAFSLVVGIFATLATVSNRLLKWALVAGLTLALVVTYSRGGSASLVLGLFAYVGIRFARRLRVIMTGRLGGGWGFFSLSLLVGGVLLLFGLTWAAQSSRIAPYWNQGSVTLRFQLAREALHIWTSNFLIGVGPGEFRAIVANEVHNSFLQMGAEMGVVGFAALAGLAWLGFRNASYATLNAISSDDVRLFATMTAGVVVVVTIGLTLSLLGEKLMWAMLAIGAVATGKEDEEPEPIPRTQDLEDVRRWSPRLRA
jgi:hypothetical protein